MTTEKTRDILIGAWRLTSYSVRTASGRYIDLWGKDPAGLLIYLSDGYMSVHVSNKGRPKFVANDFLFGSSEEIKCAFEGYTTYFGTYEYDADKGVVFHHVHESLFPNWSGVTQRRLAEVAGHTLMLRTPPVAINGEKCVMELCWQRLN